MNKLLCCLLIGSLIYASTPKYSTLSAVTVAGAIIKSSQNEPTIIKYKRKDCPVCKGKGWYMSGDNIKKIDCTYCEPDNESQN
jgi:hypothetical protein